MKKLILNVAMIALSVGLVAGIQATRNQSSSFVAPSVVAGVASPSPTPEPTPAPSPSPTPAPTGKPCTPGYWKNHLDQFNAVCGNVSGWTCDSLLTALTCKGADATCQRSAAAGALDSLTGCTESN